MGKQKRATTAAVWVLACIVCLPLVSGGASCCMSKNIPKVVDPYAVQPEWWDEEDDGPWEAGLVEVSKVKDFDWEAMRLKGWWRWKHEFKTVALDSSGWLLAGLVVAGLGKACMPKPETVSAFLGGRGGVSSALAGAAVGLAVPACSCGVIPLAVAAVDSGASVSGAVALTFVSSGSGIDSFFHTVGQGGYSTALSRMAAVSLLGVFSTIVAWLLSSSSKPSSKALGAASCGTGEGACCAPAATSAVAPSSSSASATAFLRAGFEGVLGAYEEVIVYIAAGVAVTAIMHAWEPDDGWGFSGSSGGGASDLVFRLSLLSASLPLQMCEHAVVNLAKAMVDAGVSAGTAFAWLVLSPASSMGWFLLISRHQGFVAAVGATLTVVLGAAAIAAAIDALGIGVPGPDAAADENFMRADLPAWFVDASMPGLCAMGALSLTRAAYNRIVAGAPGAEKLKQG